MKSLTNIIYKYKDKEFAWGKFDCCIFTAKVVEEYTGKDLPYWKDVLEYDSPKEAMKTLRKLGCTELKDLPSIILNTERQPGNLAKLGDPVYYINEEGQGILGICNGVRSYFLQDGRGLTARMTNDCKYCWKVK